MMSTGPTLDDLTEEVAELRAQLTEANETLRAIRSGEVDAVLAQGPQGVQLFTLKGADDPYRVLIEEMNQGAVTLSTDGSILYGNRRFAELVKMPLEEIVGATFDTLVALAERDEFAALLAAGRSGGRTAEITLSAGDGSAVPLQLALAPLPAESAAAICLVATDISESREKEARLHRTMAALVNAEEKAGAARAEAERANAAKSDFLANMSHEIRTPMNGIIGMTELVLETDLDPVPREYLGMVKTSAHALLGLINDILDFSKIEAGKLELESLDFSLRETIDHLLRPLHFRGAKKGLELRADIGTGVPDHLVGDPLRLRQILLNFVDNALKFTTRGSIVLRVVAEVDDDDGGGQFLHFSVADTGIGIPLEKQEEIFEAFAQVDGSTTRNYGGTGLGLAIATQLVGRMGGKTWIESALGQGTTFHFTARFGLDHAARRLDSGARTAPVSPEEAHTAIEPLTTAGLHILLAEDNAINRALATALLEKRGHTLVHAANGREAVAAADGEAFDLILMDIQMPEVDGFEATLLIRESEQATGRRHTPIAAMTAHAMAGDRDRCLGAGMDDYLSKPLDKAALLKVLERASVQRFCAVVAPAAPGRATGAAPAIIPPLGKHARICAWGARVACLLAFAIGLAVLAGWLFDIRLLTTVLPGYGSMKPNTALGLCFSGLSLYLFVSRGAAERRGSRKFSTWFAGAVALLGALTLCEHTTGFNFRIDELLFQDYFTIAGRDAPGRMAPIAAFNFVCLGLALVLLHFPRRMAWAQALTSAAALTSLLAIIGYFYGAAALYHPGNFTAVGLHTTLAFLTLCLGVWCATSEQGFMQILTGYGTSGRMARRYGIAAIVLPFLFGWMRLQGLRHGWFGDEVGLALFALANVVTFVALVRIGAGSLRHAEEKQTRAQKELRKAHADLEDRVLERTAELGTANAGLLMQMMKRASAEQSYQQIMDYSLDVICTIDAGGRFLQASRASEAVWGYRPEELIGRPFLDMVHPDDREKTMTVDRSIMNGKPENDFENRYLRRDGTVVPILWTANWSEQHQTTFCVARDMTSRKQVEEDLLRAREIAESANRTKSEFLANMSHEIRTPMNGIIGMTDLVLDTHLDREQREYLGMAKSSAYSLLGLINDILDFSKIEAGRLELEAIHFSLRASLATMLKPLGLRAGQKGLELTADIGPEVPDHVIGDPTRLGQILINLIDNAIKFTARGDVMLRVAVGAGTDAAPELHFTVTDTGVGIPASKLTVIFEAFAQADGSTTRHFGGTGLGLAIAVQLVRQMGGRMWVESTVGQGTAFHFTVHLPVQEGAAPDVLSADPFQLAGLRVLVVDDNAVNRRILSEMLTQWQMQTTTSASGAEALGTMVRAKHAGHPYPLVLLDGMMPTMDGFMMVEQIRANPDLADTIVVMLSSAMPTGVAARCQELGVAGYLTKPVSQAELLQTILAALGGAEGKEPVADAALRERATRPLHILLAEDNLINHTLATALLEKRGHSLVHAVDGRAAVEAALGEAFDLILMDVQMPEMDGFEATQCIRTAEQATGHHTPIAAMTAHALAGDRERCLAAGMDDYLSKPLQKAALVALLERIAAEAPATGVPTSEPLLNGHREPDLLSIPGSASPDRPRPIFSREKLLDELDGDEELMRRMVALFHENTPRLLEDIRQAVAQRHSSNLARAAHALLSSLGAFGAQAAYELTRQLEKQAGDENYDDTDETFAALERETTAIHEALSTLVSDLADLAGPLV